MNQKKTSRPFLFITNVNYNISLIVSPGIFLTFYEIEKNDVYLEIVIRLLIVWRHL